MIRVFLACDDQDYGNKICRQLQNQRNPAGKFGSAGEYERHSFADHF